MSFDEWCNRMQAQYDYERQTHRQKQKHLIEAWKLLNGPNRPRSQSEWTKLHALCGGQIGGIGGLLGSLGSAVLGGLTSPYPDMNFLHDLEEEVKLHLPNGYTVKARGHSEPRKVAIHRGAQLVAEVEVTFSDDWRTRLLVDLEADLRRRAS